MRLASYHSDLPRVTAEFNGLISTAEEGVVISQPSSAHIPV